MPVRGYETAMAQRLSAELRSRMATACEIAAPRVEAIIKNAAAPYTDTGETMAGISVEPYGSVGRGVFGLIAKSAAKSSEWLDKGTRPQITSNRGRGGYMKVGARSPNRANAPIKGVTTAQVVSGQKATNFFSAPQGVPLNRTMSNIVGGLFRRAR